MNPIKEAMKESYKGHGLSQAKKLETRQKALKQPKMVVPAIISTVVTVSIFFFVFLTIDDQHTEFEMSASISNHLELEDAVIVMMERKLQFQKILEDGEITEAERMEYLRTSDWKLQLAFERSTNTTYAIPEITEEQGILYATLLFYMREYMLEPKSISEVTAAFTEVRDFQQLVNLVPVLERYVLAEYLLSEDEDLPAENVFFKLAQWLQVIIVMIYALMLIFIIKNLIARQKKLLIIANLLIVMLTAIFLFKPLGVYYANDENTLLLSSLKGMHSIGLATEDTKLVSSATFDNSRFALFQELDRHTLVRFQKRDNYYQFSGIDSWSHTQHFSTKYHVRNDGQAIYVIALTEGHPIKKGNLVIHDVEKRTFEFTVEKGKAAIEALYLPQKDISFELKFYDENGEVVK